VDEMPGTLTATATREVDGVYSMGTGSARMIGAVRQRVPGTRTSETQGVAVEVGERQAAADLDLVVEYGVSIPDLAAAVRGNGPAPAVQPRVRPAPHVITRSAPRLPRAERGGHGRLEGKKRSAATGEAAARLRHVRLREVAELADEAGGGLPAKANLPLAERIG
jgi:hypothetical protein